MAKILVVDDSPSKWQISWHSKPSSPWGDWGTHRRRGIPKANEQLPDVILMDVVMPEMNGFQATRKITRDPKTSHIPVVIISTKNQNSARVGQASGR